MPLTDLANRLLVLHAQRNSELFYGAEALNAIFRDADLALLDRAYEELVADGLMERTGVTISYFGMPKTLHRLTETGVRRAREMAA